MPGAVRVHSYGGPDVLNWEEVEVRSPGPGEARIRQTAIGLNYIDVYHRTGYYKLPALPAVIGMEGAGEVLEVGPGVADIAVGDRVAYAGALGSYADERIIAADRLVVIPSGINERTAAAMMLQGMTARYLLRQTYNVRPGTTILMHAAAGGVGLILCQWARHLGATVIGTVSTPEKAALAEANGCAHTINVKSEDFVARVKEITGGAGCDVVYDSIGKDTFPGSLDCLRPLGLWVSFGNASGSVPPFDISLLSAKGSLFATRPTIMTYIAKRADLLANAAELFSVVADGHVRIAVNQTYPLRDAAAAHRDLEARRTTGSTVLLP